MNDSDLIESSSTTPQTPLSMAEAFHQGGMNHFRSNLQLFVPYTVLSGLGFLVGICGRYII